MTYIADVTSRWAAAPREDGDSILQGHLHTTQSTFILPVRYIPHNAIVVPGISGEFFVSIISCVVVRQSSLT